MNVLLQVRGRERTARRRGASLSAADHFQPAITTAGRLQPMKHRIRVHHLHAATPTSPSSAPATHGSHAPSTRCEGQRARGAGADVFDGDGHGPGRHESEFRLDAKSAAESARSGHLSTRRVLAARALSRARKTSRRQPPGIVNSSKRSAPSITTNASSHSRDTSRRRPRKA